jgi:hypothetical protein
MKKMSIRALVAPLAFLLSGSFATGTEQPKDLPVNEEVWCKALPNKTIEEIHPEPRFTGMYEIVLGYKLGSGNRTNITREGEVR